MKKISVQQILLMHTQLISKTGGMSGIRDIGLIESAVAAPFASFGGTDLYPTLEAKAAQLGFSLIQNHAFLDGNKRIAVHAMLVFLALNNIKLQYTQRELADMFLGLAAGIADYQDELTWISTRNAANA